MRVAIHAHQLHSLSKIFQDPLISFMIFQDVCLRQELLVYMGVHVNDASESSKPSWREKCVHRAFYLQLEAF